jgi:hypothetical protein
MPTTPHPIDSTLDAIRAGHRAIVLGGRSLRDVHTDQAGHPASLRSILLQRVQEEFGIGTVSFSLALGGAWEWDGFDSDERTAFEQRLKAANVPLGIGISASADHARSSYERAYLLLGSVYKSLSAGSKLPPLLLLIEFGEDIVPCQDRGTASAWVVQIAELLQLIAADTRRDLRLTVLISGLTENMEKRVLSHLHSVHLPQPDRLEKAQFIAALRQSVLHAGATLEEGLDDTIVANLTSRTPNFGLEQLYYESAATGKPVTHIALTERKRRDVVAISEGTLNLLDTERVAGIHLVGRTIQRPFELMQSWAEGIKRGDPRTPTNVIFCGAPSTAKTDLALLTALLSRTPVYSILSPKASFVGQTEARVRLLFRLFKELSPSIGVIDEISEAFPTERNTQNLDSGATQAVVAEMLNALSDSSRAGRTLIIATTNCPWKVSDAMGSRFVFVPVLSAVEEDYPAILCSIAANLMPEVSWDPQNNDIRIAAAEFYRKGASPRVMRTLISSKIATTGTMGASLLTRAARACAPQDPRSRASAEYADLFAIRKCSDLEMLPWHGVTDYPLPAYLKGIVDVACGEIDQERLDRRIRELEPIANV